VFWRISVIVVSANGGIINQFRFALAEVLRVELGEGEVGVAVQGHVGAEAVLVHQLRDELGREGDDEGLQKRIRIFKVGKNVLFLSNAMMKAFKTNLNC
jgi:hypothetical protein